VRVLDGGLTENRHGEKRDAMRLQDPMDLGYRGLAIPK
jgi:hypothetical protein